jgi:hypothetical protein
MEIIKDIAYPTQRVQVTELHLKFANQKSQKKLNYNVPDLKCKYT